MTLAEGLAYGIVQGLTEFLPISSSAHLILLPWLFGWNDPGLGFDVAIHVGTLVAVVGYFWRDWWELVTAALADLRGGSIAGSASGALFWKIVAASIPAALIGVALEHAAQEPFRAPGLIAATLAGVGALLYWSDTQPEDRVGLGSIEWGDALWIGVAQAAAIVPGVSRSGVTITAARLRGIDRAGAARFSFLLSTPIIAGAAALEVKALAAAVQDPAQLAALVAAAVFGGLAIGGLLRYVRGRSYLPFVVYRFALAALVVVVIVVRA